MTPVPAVLFLDRDGVVLQAVAEEGLPKSIRKPTDIRYVDGLSELLRHSATSGLKVYVVTNQPDIARGKTTQTDVEAVHAQILKDHPTISAVLYCPHDDNARCACRKPKPGLLEEVAKKEHAALAQSILVGDRWRDIDAGNAVGCYTIFIDYRYREALSSQPDMVIHSLHEAAVYIEARRNERGCV